MGYADGMTNAQSYASPEETLRIRGRILGNLLREDRWSNRAAGAKLGLSHTYVGKRVNGEVDISLSDIDAFARLLRLEPTVLYDAIINGTPVTAPYPRRHKSHNWGDNVTPIRGTFNPTSSDEGSGAHSEPAA